MLFEKQVCKQISDQPAYITSEQMLKMQRASMIRYEKTLNEAHFLPLFFSYTNELIKKADDFVSRELCFPQQCHLQTKSDIDVSKYISGLVRTVRSLPIVLKNVPVINATQRPTYLPCKSSYDLVYHYFADKPLELNEFAQKVASLYNTPEFKVVPFIGGVYIIDPTQKKDTVIQNRCLYTPYDKETVEIPPLEEIPTPEVSTIEKLAEFTGKTKEFFVKAVMYSIDGKLVFVNIRGDLEVSEAKLRNFLGITDSNIEVQLAPLELLERHGLVPGFSGLVGVKRASECILICDDSVKTVGSGVTGANKRDYHYINFNVERDTAKIAKFIQYADVAENPSNIEGVIVAEINDCNYYYPEMIGLDSKPTKSHLYKMTLRLVDITAATIGKTMKIKGAYIINIGKDDTKLKLTVAELLKYCPPECVIVDDRAKPNFGAKMQLNEIALMQNVIVVSSKLDAETVSVNDQPVKIVELSSIFN